MQRGKTLGSVRTFVHLDAAFTAPAWLEGLRQGHTFFSTGPLLEFRVGGKIPGGVVRLPAGGGTVVFEGTARCAGPLTKVMIYHRRGVFREIPLNAQADGARFREEVRVTESDWFSLAAEGPAYGPFDAAFALAATNAVRVYAGEQKIRDRESAEYFLRWIEILRRETAQWRWWRSQAEKDHIFAQYDEAQRVYERFIQEAR